MFETLKNLLVEELQLNPDEITLESDLANDLGVNSIELADMIMICEDTHPPLTGHLPPGEGLGVPGIDKLQFCG